MSIRGRIALLMTPILLLTFFSLVPVHAALSWNFQKVDNNAYTLEGRCPIVLDSNNSPHIAYTDVHVESDGFQTTLAMYASLNGSGWNTQQIAKGRTYSLALDADDKPYILYSRSWEPLMCAS